MSDIHTRYQDAYDSSPLVAKLDELDIATESALLVCLCDQSPSDDVLWDRHFGNWRLCKEHNGAVKLVSLNGANVVLWCIDSNGDYGPMRTEPAKDVA